jgi:tripartite-type tricarboxylate transporter receptor subunit TctC
VGLDTATVMLPQVKAGKLRLIAVGSSKRLSDVPDIPTISELGFPGFEAVAWIGLTSPSGMPRYERERIQNVITKALISLEFADKLRSIGAIPRPMTIDEFAAFMQSEQVRWKAIVEQSGIKL